MATVSGDALSCSSESWRREWETFIGPAPVRPALAGALVGAFPCNQRARTRLWILRAFLGSRAADEHRARQGRQQAGNRHQALVDPYLPSVEEVPVRTHRQGRPGDIDRGIGPDCRLAGSAAR